VSFLVSVLLVPEHALRSPPSVAPPLVLENRVIRWRFLLVVWRWKGCRMVVVMGRGGYHCHHSSSNSPISSSGSLSHHVGAALISSPHRRPLLFNPPPFSHFPFSGLQPRLLSIPISPMITAEMHCDGAALRGETTPGTMVTVDGAKIAAKNSSDLFCGGEGLSDLMGCGG
ncbi:hypothetical protein Drorol1_Dr00005211, partial [Drosera rotundifolia]